MRALAWHSAWMLAYRHAFHAGNHADVLKHLVLLAMVDALKRKDAPFFVLDTHAGRGHYLLTMQYGLDADDLGTFKGEAAEDGIAFTRPDGPQLLRAGDGEATGLKWLADKKDCLIVDTGEGYCR